MGKDWPTITTEARSMVAGVEEFYGDAGPGPGPGPGTMAD